MTAAQRSDADEVLSPRPREPRIPLVYIAGPYTAPDALGVELNVRAAELVAYSVARLGAMPVCPHTNLRYMASDLAEFLYPATLEMMRRCDAVLLIEGWKRSRGAIGEHREAIRLGLPTFDTLDGLRGWLGGRR